MEFLSLGIALAYAGILAAVVGQQAVDRGRNQWGWAIASFIGLFVGFIGYLVVFIGLLIVGPTKEKKEAEHQETAAAAQ